VQWYIIFHSGHPGQIHSKGHTIGFYSSKFSMSQLLHLIWHWRLLVLSSATVKITLYHLFPGSEAERRAGSCIFGIWAKLMEPKQVDLRGSGFRALGLYLP